MRYYRKKLNGSEWERVGVLTALIELVRPRRGWDLRYVRWHIDMLSVPNVISCADAELLLGDPAEYALLQPYLILE